MSDLEQRVTNEMRRRADAMQVPLPHLDALVRDGEVVRARGRRRLVLVAAAAVVAVLATGPWLVGRAGGDPRPVGPRPSPPPSQTPGQTAKTLDDLPQGAPPAVPYLQGGALHVHGRVVDTTANELLAMGSTVVVGRVGGQGAHWWLLTGDRLTPVAELDGVYGPRLAPSGDLLAWTSYPDVRTTRVTAWDPRARREVAHVDLDAPYSQCCGGGQQIELLGIDAQDTVYWHDDRHSPDLDVWQPGSAPKRQAGPVDESALGASPPAAPFDHALPQGTKVEGIVVEPDGSVLVDAFVDPRRHYVLRCVTPADRCERTLPPGRISTWVFPDARS